MVLKKKKSKVATLLFLLKNIKRRNFMVEILEQFKDEYEKFFLERFIYSSAELENFDTYDMQRKMLINLSESYQHLIEKMDFLTLTDILKVGNMVNRGSNLAAGFRKIEVTAGSKANFTPSMPNRIVLDLQELLYNYYFMWEGLDVYLKEAIFHIKFMRIHPFEDGNKRTGKLILTTNLCKQGYAPIIITKEDTDDYYHFINEYDYAGFAEFIKQRSELENNTMCGFYKSKNNISIYDKIDNNEIQNALAPQIKKKFL
jgi:Fic family protein